MQWKKMFDAVNFLHVTIDPIRKGLLFFFQNDMETIGFLSLHFYMFFFESLDRPRLSFLLIFFMKIYCNFFENFFGQFSTRASVLSLQIIKKFSDFMIWQLASHNIQSILDLSFLDRATCA